MLQFGFSRKQTQKPFTAQEAYQELTLKSPRRKKREKAGLGKERKGVLIETQWITQPHGRIRSGHCPSQVSCIEPNWPFFSSASNRYKPWASISKVWPCYWQLSAALAIPNKLTVEDCDHTVSSWGTRPELLSLSRASYRHFFIDVQGAVQWVGLNE